MAIALSKQEVEQLMSMLGEEQRGFLAERSKQSKKSKWVESLARQKGIVIDRDMPYEDMEKLIDDWILIDILDSGFGNRDYRCECGRALRFQYQVHHKKDGKTYGLGSTCFEHHTSLSPAIVKDIVDGFHTVDLERDEILQRFFRDDNKGDITPFLYIDTVPEEYMEQFRLGLPLSSQQMAKVVRLKAVYDEKHKHEIAIKSLTILQEKVFRTLDKADQGEVIEKLIANTDRFDAADLADLPAGTIDEEMEAFLAANLPLLDRHNEKVREKRYELGVALKRGFFQQEPLPQREYQASRKRVTHHSLNVHELLEMHLPTLKKVRQKEQHIPPGLKNDWLAIQDTVRKGLKGEEINYTSFKVNLMNICFALKVEMDEYL